MSKPELALYMKPTCPYCIKVLNFIEEQGLKVALRNIAKHEEHRETLIKVGGKQQVPCLFIDGKPLYESGDIIAYLKQHGA